VSFLSQLKSVTDEVRCSDYTNTYFVGLYNLSAQVARSDQVF